MALRMRQDNPTFYDETHEWRVTFYPIKNCPGFSHKVIINCRPAGWLSSEVRPSGKTAAYFLEKFGPYIESQMAQAS